MRRAGVAHSGQNLWKTRQKVTQYINIYMVAPDHDSRVLLVAVRFEGGEHPADLGLKTDFAADQHQGQVSRRGHHTGRTTSATESRRRTVVSADR